MNPTDDAPNQAESRHRQAWDLIPWVVNGSASAESQRVVGQHLADCADCREEYEFQSRLRSAMQAEPAAAADPRPPLQQLWRRIDAAAEPAVPRIRRGAGSGLVRGLLAAVLVEAVGIAALGVTLMARDGAAPPAVYRTLSSASAAEPPAAIRAVLAPELSQQHLQDLLARAQLQIVAGPGDSGVYSLAPRSSAFDAAASLALLRADPGVRLAEPVNGATRPQQ